jgi:hypothetical protein
MDENVKVNRRGLIKAAGAVAATAAGMRIARIWSHRQQQPQLGHGDRPEQMHRLRLLHQGLPSSQ